MSGPLYGLALIGLIVAAITAWVLAVMIAAPLLAVAA
jgi:uncharacterized membrane protein